MRRGSLFIAVLLFVAGSGWGADFRMEPSLTLSEEFTDNVFQDDRVRKSDFITRLLPGISARYEAPALDWDASYFLDYRYYARQTKTDDTTHQVSTKGKLKMLDEKVFLEVSDEYKRVSLEYARDTSVESLFVNQSDQNTFSVSPYVVLRPSPAVAVTSGYRYTNIWYREPSGVDKRRQAAFLSGSIEVSPALSVTLGYTFSHEDYGTGYFRYHTAFVGPRYEYAAESFVFAQAGAVGSRRDVTLTELHSSIPFRKTYRGSSIDPFWQAGLNHAFDSATVNLSTAVAYTEDPRGISLQERSYGGSIRWKFTRGSAGLSSSYSDFREADSHIRIRSRFTAGSSGDYELTDDLRGSLGYTYERYGDAGDFDIDSLRVRETVTARQYIDSGVVLQLGYGWKSSLTYRFIKFSSHDSNGENKHVNRAIAEISGRF